MTSPVIKTLMFKDNNDVDVELEISTDWVPASNLIPYRTFEKTFYGRNSVLKTRKEILAREDYVKRFEHNKEAFNNLKQLLRERNLHKSIIPVKKSINSEWVSFRPAYIEARYLSEEHLLWKTENASTDEYEYMRNDLFTYDIAEGVVDTCEFYAYHTQKMFGVKSKLVFTTHYDYRFLNEENIVKMLDMLVEVKAAAAKMFETKNSVMSDRQFAEILSLIRLHRYGFIQGTVKAWVAYMIKGYSFYEVAYAFNSKIYTTRPVPASILKDYVDAPLEWVAAVMGKNNVLDSLTK